MVVGTRLQLSGAFLSARRILAGGILCASVCCMHHPVEGGEEFYHGLFAFFSLVVTEV